MKEIVLSWFICFFYNGGKYRNFVIVLEIEVWKIILNILIFKLGINLWECDLLKLYDNKIGFIEVVGLLKVGWEFIVIKGGSFFVGGWG